MNQIGDLVFFKDSGIQVCRLLDHKQRSQGRVVCPNVLTMMVVDHTFAKGVEISEIVFVMKDGDMLLGGIFTELLG